MACLQFVQQRFGLLQIFGVKAFGEPLVDLGQHLVSFALLALRLPQAGKAHRCTEFERFGLLLPGDLDGFEETRFSFGLRIGDQQWRIYSFGSAATCPRLVLDLPEPEA